MSFLVFLKVGVVVGLVLFSIVVMVSMLIVLVLWDRCDWIGVGVVLMEVVVIMGVVGVVDVVLLVGGVLVGVFMCVSCEGLLVEREVFKLFLLVGKMGVLR